MQNIKHIFETLSTFGKIIVLFLSILVGIVIASLLVELLQIDRTNIQSIKIEQLISTLFIILLPALVCGYLFFEPTAHKTKQALSPPTLKIVSATLLLMLSISPFVHLLTYLNEQVVLPDALESVEKTFKEMEKAAKIITEKILSVNTIGGLMGNIVIVAILPAISEELLFRGTLLGILRPTTNRHIAVWIVGIVFSLIHFQMYGFVPRMVLGALFGYLFVWSGTIWLPIVAHFTNNFLVVLLFFWGKGTISTGTISALTPSQIWIYGVISLIVSAFIIRYIKKNSNQ